MKTENLFDLDFVSADNFNDILNQIFDYDTNNKKLPVVATPNLDQLVQFSEYPDIFEFIKQSFLILPDGQPIVWASKLFKKPLRSRLSGSDLFPLFWKKAKEYRSKILCIAPSEEVGKLLQNDYNHCLIFVPPFFDQSDNSIIENMACDISQIITTENIKYVIVGLSLPKRELLTMKIITKLEKEKPVFLLLGAAFEFYLGIKPRAPTWVRRLGLEWLYRFLSEPRRLFKRYFIDSWYFLYLIYEEIRRNEK
jgi:N-acetylglucosaminyldiphosphoundecaprenol N-acetyl-beta-D-mannosaminyltransferase